jgi:hypothetical protein
MSQQWTRCCNAASFARHLFSLFTSPSHMETCVQNLKIHFFLISKLFFISQQFVKHVMRTISVETNRAQMMSKIVLKFWKINFKILAEVCM